MNNFFRRLKAKFLKKKVFGIAQGPWPQYRQYFKKRYGISVWAAGDDLFIKKPNGSVTRIVDANSYTELFDAIERIGKAL